MGGDQFPPFPHMRAHGKSDMTEDSVYFGGMLPKRYLPKVYEKVQMRLMVVKERVLVQVKPHRGPIWKADGRFTLHPYVRQGLRLKFIDPPKYHYMSSKLKNQTFPHNRNIW